eukprot:6181738-Pleurochrysis_carterae.AAC.1
MTPYACARACTRARACALRADASANSPRRLRFPSLRLLLGSLCSPYLGPFHRLNPPKTTHTHTPVPNAPTHIWREGSRLLGRESRVLRVHPSTARVPQRRPMPRDGLAAAARRRQCAETRPSVERCPRPIASREPWPITRRVALVLASAARPVRSTRSPLARPLPAHPNVVVTRRLAAPCTRASLALAHRGAPPALVPRTPRRVPQRAACTRDAPAAALLGVARLFLAHFGDALLEVRAASAVGVPTPRSLLLAPALAPHAYRQVLDVEAGRANRGEVGAALLERALLDAPAMAQLICADSRSTKSEGPADGAGGLSAWPSSPAAHRGGFTFKDSSESCFVFTLALSMLTFELFIERRMFGEGCAESRDAMDCCDERRKLHESRKCDGK